MSYTDGTPQTPAGWYPDPAGSGYQRWWNGLQWTDNLQAPQQPAPPVPPVQSQSLQQPHSTQAYQPTPGYPTAPANAGYAPSAPPTVPPGTPVYNVFIWLLTLLPLVSLLMLPLTFTELDQVMRASIEDPYAVSPYAGYSTGGLVLQAVTTLVSWLIYGAIVVLAYFDRKWLLRQGYPQPFHWAFAFLSVVYPIGRSIVVRRRSGRGIAPMWVSIALLVLSFVLVTVVVVVIISSAIDAATTYNTYS